ncbi:DUF4384 domain-containing protein [Tropicibacter naphthalenivorans]|uniref:DUF4384 domain-containing protein n=1 Tax=Tropicibacter naphthalenivorans TaxID=441103 RepID=A0A0P1GFR1_9RHOB|nr:DUF4384 domain-containing protein [Tropicibacter naphthalenivorans]CUH75272.1 hypothetical protein TRN7648_00355 [Tropicibacter naphthalenivorans]SMC45307.1 protein of unknown function [Tropicibacter naphthalenivorans]
MTPRNWIKAAAVGALGLTALPAFANDAMPLPAGASDLDKAAYDVLDKHCARCHQDGALKDGMTQPKSGFGHVLDLKRLAQDTKFVIHGKPIGSKLYDVIGEYSFPAMPDDCTDSACFPTDAEMKIVADWITELGNQAPPERTFVSLEELHKLAHDDLQQQPTNRRDRIRYLSMRSIWNNKDVSEENYEGYKNATVKLVNALSWNPTPYKFEKVDPHGVLLRVYLPEINWDADKWHLLEMQYPYAMQSDTDPYLSPLQHMSGTQVPIIRADWFASTAPVSPLYYDLLGLPDTVAGLEALLNLDINANIQNELVVRAGFQNSGVSTNNRLIERHPLQTGFFWTSYDFAGSKGRQSFFEYPLGPVEAYGPELAFNHDGGESIFTLPNGFHAYYLNTAEGARLDVGPTSIVRDDDYGDGTGEVVNGISCMSCHNKGIRLNEDKVREVAMNDFSLSPEARQTIDATFPGAEVVAEWFQKDTDQFFAALESAGIPAETTAGGLEPIRGLFVYHVDRFINFAQAANELGLTEEELRGRAGFVGVDMASLINRLQVSPIARDEWAVAYPAMLEKVTEYRPIKAEKVAAADLSYSVNKVVQGTDYAPPAAKTPPPAKTVAPATSYADAQKAPDYVPTQHSVQAQSHLTVYTDKPTYKVGEGLRVFIEPRQDCRLTLISIDDRKRSCVLYPFPGLEDIVIPGGTQYVFPPRGSLKTTEAGLETILAICNGSNAAISAERQGYDAVSCAAADHESTYKAVVNEVLALDLNDTPDKVTNAGASYKAVSDHNPNVTKAQISVVVSDY